MHVVSYFHGAINKALKPKNKLVRCFWMCSWNHLQNSSDISVFQISSQHVGAADKGLYLI